MKSNRKPGPGKKATSMVVQRPAASMTSPAASYEELLSNIKAKIGEARVRALLSVNRELVLLYWWVGREILSRQEMEGWGAKTIDRLACDIRIEFPELKGFSPRNLKYMRAFAGSYHDLEFVQQLAALIPWFHNCTILDKVKGLREREWYIRATIDNGWSRAVLVHQIG